MQCRPFGIAHFAVDDRNAHVVPRPFRLARLLAPSHFGSGHRRPSQNDGSEPNRSIRWIWMGDGEFTQPTESLCPSYPHSAGLKWTVGPMRNVNLYVFLITCVKNKRETTFWRPFFRLSLLSYYTHTHENKNETSRRAVRGARFPSNRLLVGALLHSLRCGRCTLWQNNNNVIKRN